MAKRAQTNKHIFELGKTIRAVQDVVKSELTIHVKTILRLHDVCVKQQHLMKKMSEQIIKNSHNPTRDLEEIGKDFDWLQEDLLHVLPPMTTTGKDTGRKK